MDTVDNEKKVTFLTLGAAGEGGIQAKPEQMERIDEVTERVGRGEFHRPTVGSIPCTCIDGRCGATEGLMPNAAGGSLTLMVADDLTTKKFASGTDGLTCSQYETMVDYLKDAGHSVGGHTAAELHGAPSGCGANDKLPAIYEYISRNAETLRGLANMLGYDIGEDDADHALIASNATARSEFSGGAELLKTLKTAGGRVDELQGGHEEVVAVINRRAGMTLDRDAVRATFGDAYQSFNIDEWSFEEGARAISGLGSDNEVRQKRIAMLYYNLATAGVLCGPGMRVVVLDGQDSPDLAAA